MSCCPIIETGEALSVPIVYELPLTNLTDTGGVLTRSGGVPGTGDAFANDSQWVEGTGCAYWQWTITNAVESNELIYVIYPEDLSVGGYGWYFTNFIVNFRRTPFINGSAPGFPIFYHNSTLGYNHFALLYNNGTLKLYETGEFATTDPGWIIPESYAYTGLPTGTRWRLRIYVKPAAVSAQSSPVIENIGAAGDICGTSDMAFPVMQWSATAEITSAVLRGGTATKRFDAGEGNEYFLCAPVVDSGQELRSKVVKSVRQTGKRTNVNAKIYSYDVDDNIDVTALEDGTGSTTGAIALDDSTQVSQSPRVQTNCPNAVLHTVRIDGSDVGQSERDRIDEIVVEVAEMGVRR
jgi:hypothetical protein